MNTEHIVFLAVAAGTFLLTVIFSRIIIPKLISLKMGQKILEIGPRWHKNKEGTPTMGGLAFIFAIAAVTLIVVPLLLYKDYGWDDLLPWLLTLGLAVLSGAIGLGILYYVLSLILITGVVNSVNLTDGIDGLASSETFVAGAFFALCAFAVGSLSAVIGSAAAVGAALGFLIYNFYPARVFMGDTGSLFFGGLLVGLAYTLENPLIILCFGCMFIAETLSVMLQVTFFKLTKKRIFKMAPIHHHFEMCGWKETKIVGIFCLIALIFSSISFILEYII